MADSYPNPNGGRHHSNRPLFAAIIDRNEGNVRLENRGFRGAPHIRHAHLIGDGCRAFPGKLAVDAEDRPVPNSLAELDLIHGDRDELAVGKLRRSGDPGRLIDPCEQSSTEQRAVVVQITG